MVGFTTWPIQIQLNVGCSFIIRLSILVFLMYLMYSNVFHWFQPTWLNPLLVACWIIPWTKAFLFQEIPFENSMPVVINNFPLPPGRHPKLCPIECISPHEDCNSIQPRKNQPPRKVTLLLEPPKNPESLGLRKIVRPPSLRSGTPGTFQSSRGSSRTTSPMPRFPRLFVCPG